MPASEDVFADKIKMPKVSDKRFRKRILPLSSSESEPEGKRFKEKVKKARKLRVRSNKTEGYYKSLLQKLQDLESEIRNGISETEEGSDVEVNSQGKYIVCD